MTVHVILIPLGFPFKFLKNPKHFFVIIVDDKLDIKFPPNFNHAILIIGYKCQTKKAMLISQLLSLQFKFIVLTIGVDYMLGYNFKL